MLADLPAHDLLRARALADVLAGLGEVPIRLVCSAASPALAQLRDEPPPGADLLEPIGGEHAWAARAGACDVVLACDPADRYERAGERAEPARRVAAACGPAAITARLRELLPPH